MLRENEDPTNVITFEKSNDVIITLCLLFETPSNVAREVIQSNRTAADSLCHERMMERRLERSVAPAAAESAILRWFHGGFFVPLTKAKTYLEESGTGVERKWGLARLAAQSIPTATPELPKV